MDDGLAEQLRFPNKLDKHEMRAFTHVPTQPTKNQKHSYTERSGEPEKLTVPSRLTETKTRLRFRKSGVKGGGKYVTHPLILFI